MTISGFANSIHYDSYITFCFSAFHANERLVEPDIWHPLHLERLSPCDICVAARWYGHRDIRIENIPEPERLPGQVKAGADPARQSAVHSLIALDPPLGQAFLSTPPSAAATSTLSPKKDPAPATAHPLTGEATPVVFGHEEFSALVAPVGEGVRSVKPNDRVAIYPLLSDGTLRLVPKRST
ncbi:hypothetical protein VTO42DRAFT_7091 [Malbranchea cinnamomea]